MTTARLREKKHTHTHKRNIAKAKTRKLLDKNGLLIQADLVKSKIYKNVTFLPIWHSLKNNWRDQLTPLGTYLNR